MATRKSVMHQLVKDEAKKLKELASKTEIQNLNFEELRPNSAGSCVYGQMTGNCYTTRAEDLIKQCCTRVYERESWCQDIKDSKVNGSPKKLERGSFWSPIEVFIDTKINQTNGNNERLVKYLKDETQTLDFV